MELIRRVVSGGSSFVSDGPLLHDPGREGVLGEDQGVFLDALVAAGLVGIGVERELVLGERIVWVWLDDVRIVAIILRPLVVLDRGGSDLSHLLLDLIRQADDVFGDLLHTRLVEGRFPIVASLPQAFILHKDNEPT
jgi:hypothetical protein